MLGRSLRATPGAGLLTSSRQNQEDLWRPEQWERRRNWLAILRGSCQGPALPAPLALWRAARLEVSGVLSQADRRLLRSEQQQAESSVQRGGRPLTDRVLNTSADSAVIE